MPKELGVDSVMRDEDEGEAFETLLFDSRELAEKDQTTYCIIRLLVVCLSNGVAGVKS
jgi:hypothetical protein